MIRAAHNMEEEGEGGGKRRAEGENGLRPISCRQSREIDNQDRTGGEPERHVNQSIALVPGLHYQRRRVWGPDVCEGLDATQKAERGTGVARKGWTGGGGYGRWCSGNYLDPI